MGCWLTHLGDQLLEDVVTAFLHNGKRQSLPCLIIGSRMTGRSLALSTLVEDTFAGAGPEAGRQPVQQLQDSRFHRRAKLKPLRDQQPQHHQRRIDAVVGLHAGLGECLMKELGGK